MNLYLNMDAFEISILMAFVGDGTSAGQTMYRKLKEDFEMMQKRPKYETTINLSEKSFMLCLNSLGQHNPGCPDHRKLFEKLLNIWNKTAVHHNKWRYDKQGDVIM